MTQEASGREENWKLINSVQVPPLRNFSEFFCDKSRFEIPPFRDLAKWNNRMLSNLLYYQTNYFTFMSLIVLICASLQLRDVFIGLVAIISVTTVLIFSFSSNPTFARHDHTFITLGAMLLSFYFFVYAIVPVVTVLFTLSLPLLLVLVHASTRLRSLKVKINHQLERVGLKHTAMACLLERCGIELKA
uniref:PRA1 family protein n=1 Tax=Elaeophora elaphi TaxID=1147741 RepID=A0A0R3S5G3_9BILA